MFGKKKEKKEKVKEEKRNEKAMKDTSKESKGKQKSKRSPESQHRHEESSHLSGYSQGSSGSSGYSQGLPSQHIVNQNNIYPNLPAQNGHSTSFQNGLYPNLPNQNGFVSSPPSQINGLPGTPGFLNQYGQFIPAQNSFIPQNGYMQEQGGSQNTGIGEHKYGAKNLHLLESDETERKSHRKRSKSRDRGERSRDKPIEKSDRKRDKSKDRADKKGDKSKEKSGKKKDKADETYSDKKKTTSDDKKHKKREKSKERHDKVKNSDKADKKATKKENGKFDKKMEKADHKSDKKSDKKLDKKSKHQNGILKNPNKGKMIPDETEFDTHGMHAQYTKMPGGQVTFAGPDNRVHQSVVNIQQPMMPPPDILPNNYQSIAQSPQGYVYSQQNPNQGLTPTAPPDVTYGYPAVSSPYVTQQFNGSHITPPQPQMNVSISPSAQDPTQTYIHTTPMPSHITVHQNHHDSAQTSTTYVPHVASIDIMADPYVRSRSPSPGVALRQHTGVASAQGGVPTVYVQQQQPVPQQQRVQPAQHNKGTAPSPPFVLAEVNVPNSSISAQQSDAYAKFDTLVKKARDDEIKYAQLLFDRQNMPVNAKNAQAVQKDKIANYVIEMDSDEENTNPLRLKGILKPPKRVEFNRDVDVSLFGTLHSRHESLESLWYPDPHVEYRKSIDRQRAAAQARNFPHVPHYPVQYANPPPPPPYFEVFPDRPLDDTDLHMYTMRRRRPPPMPQAFFDGTLRAPRRHSSLRLPSRGRPTMRPPRMMPAGHPMW